MIDPTSVAHAVSHASGFRHLLHLIVVALRDTNWPCPGC